MKKIESWFIDVFEWFKKWYNILKTYEKEYQEYLEKTKENLYDEADFIDDSWWNYAQEIWESIIKEIWYLELKIVGKNYSTYTWYYA